MVTALAFLGTVLDGYLLYKVLVGVNYGINIRKVRLLLFIVLNASAILLIKSLIYLNIASIALSMLISLLFLMIFYGFKISNFLAWITWLFFAVVSEFVSFLPFVILPEMNIVSVIRDDNIFTMLVIILSKFLQFFMVFLFCRLRGRSMAAVSLSFSQISLFIICFFLIFCVMFNYYWSITGESIPSVFAILFTICIIAFLLVALYNIDRIMKYAQEKEDFALMDMQVAYSKEAQLLLDKLRGMQHDYRHHLQALHVLLDKEMYEEANAYYNDMLDEFIGVELRFIDNQPIITSILLRKLHYAQKNDVKFIINVPNRLDTNIKGTDLCVIFSNILDNAFEACVNSGSVRYVNLSVSAVNDTFFIEIENSTGNIIKNKSEIFKSTKPEPFNHGYGLRSVRYLVSKYDGEVKIYPNSSEKVFKISIALPLFTDNI